MSHMAHFKVITKNMTFRFLLGLSDKSKLPKAPKLPKDLSE